MDPVWIGIAFALGFAVRMVELPPLVGFLAAGFVLNALGAEAGENLQTLSDLGVTLLLFTIGLKLKLGSLIKPQVWAVGAIHMIITVAVFGIGLFGLAAAGLSMLGEPNLKVSLLIAFALSFSSTVFAVKVLDQKGEHDSIHGRVAIGILIIQDLIAVVFLAVSAGKIPSIWAVGLVLLIPFRHVLGAALDKSGHGELVILFGFLLAVGGAYLFELVHIKGDLGALCIGVLMAQHPKASELAKSMLGFKDLFLVGFFLTIGLSGTPSLQTLGFAALLAAAAILKVILFFFLFTRFNMRARTSLLTSFTLANYSEFGLIVGAILVANNWIGPEWLITIAVALSITFVAASPLNTRCHALYATYCSRLRACECEERLQEEMPLDIGAAEIGIIGMGRVGAGAYDAVRENLGDVVVGIDYDPITIKKNLEAGRNVLLGDASDSDFWERARPGALNMVILATAVHQTNLYAVRRMKEIAPGRLIVVTAQYEDQMEELKQAGADVIFNFYTDAGVGLGDRAMKLLKT
jgi:predicted Kef-type K+ transport protein